MLGSDADLTPVLRLIARAASLAGVRMFKSAVLFNNFAGRSSFVRAAHRAGGGKREREILAGASLSSTCGFMRETGLEGRDINFAFLECNTAATRAGAAQFGGPRGGLLIAHALCLFSFKDPEDPKRRRFVLYDPHKKPRTHWGALVPVVLRKGKLGEALKLKRLFYLCGDGDVTKGLSRKLVFKFLADNVTDLAGALARAVELK